MIDRRGYNVVPEEEYYVEIMNEFKTVFPNISENPANLLCVLARIIARNENSRDYDRTMAYSDAYVATATGMALSKAVRTAGIDRLKGTRAVGKVKITKKSGAGQIIIPPNMEIKSNNLVYATTNSSAVIMNADNMDFEIASVDVGSDFNLTNGAKFDTVLNIIGIEKIVAITDVEGGTDVESDQSLRNRYFRRMGSTTNSSLRGIISAVEAVNGVTRVSGDENVTDSVKDGLKPHSYIIYVNGGVEQEIGEAIMNTKPAGIQDNGNVTVQVNVSGKNHPISFSRFTEQTVYYDLTVVIDKSISSPSFQDNLKNKIIEYTLKNNEIISYELSNYISQEMDEVKGVKKLLFGKTQRPTTNDDLISPTGQTFMTDASKINIEVL